MRRIISLTALLATFLLLQAVPARAAKLTGCTGEATSKTKTGSKTDSVTAPGPHGTQSDPFIVNYDGTVDYSGKSDSVITDHMWEVRVFLIPVKSGGSANAKHETTTSGVENVKSFLPFRSAGEYYVDGSIDGTGGSCDGWVWVKLAGDPSGTIPWFGAIALSAIGLIMMLLALRKRGRLGHLLLGFIGGLLLGVGLAVLLISYSWVFLGRLTPGAVVLVTVVIGLLIGIFAPTPSSG